MTNYSSLGPCYPLLAPASNSPLLFSVYPAPAYALGGYIRMGIDQMGSWLAHTPIGVAGNLGYWPESNRPSPLSMRSQRDRWGAALSVISYSSLFHFALV